MQICRPLLRGNRGFLAVLLVFGLVRTAIADYNPVPSGSMRPSILQGDVILVDRTAYSLKVPLTDVVLARTGEPARGDIVTFSSPRDGTRLVKRVVGLPGDRIAMHDKELVINGRPVRYLVQGVSQEPAEFGQQRRATRVREELDACPHDIQWLSGAASAPDFPPIRIPADQYLVLGDNRDNSADSRFIGLVPRRLLIGRAQRVLVSVDILDDWMPRLDRFGRSLYE